MVDRLHATDLSAMRFRDRIAAAVRFRLETADKEAVRRAVALFALPTHAAEGAGLVWQTASLIWEALGDSSQDLNWYSKRTILSAVYSGTVLFWLGDSSPGHEESWRFLDRRIENVMGFEKLKARVRDSALGRAFLDGPGRLLERIRKPESRTDLPGTSGRG
jgi:ubiquinone biosynthesis protein COQ9